jgi:CRP-like cAMP-binding protein
LDIVIANMRRYGNVDTILENKLRQIMHTRDVSKGEVLSHEGDALKKIYFIESGCLRTFNNHDGVENTIQFFFEQEWYSPYADESLQAVEAGRVVYFATPAMMALAKSFPAVIEIAQAIAQLGLECSHKRNRELVNLSAEAHYRRLLEENPVIVQRIPQKYLASYLRIKPESLSRIKRRIFQD